MSNDGVIGRLLSNRRALSEALFQRPESLGELLPYEEYNPEYKVYVNKDGSLGSVLEIELVEHEPLSGDQIIEAVRSADVWFLLPENCSVQVIHEQSAISPRDKIWDKIGSAYPLPAALSKKLLQASIDNYKDLCTRNSKVKPLRRRTFLCIRYFPRKTVQAEIRHIVERGEAFLFSEILGFSAELREFASLIASVKASSKIVLKDVAPEDLLLTLRQFFNPKEYLERDFAPFNDRASLSKQMIFKVPTLDFKGITREGITTRTIVLKTCPKFSVPGGISNFLKVPFPFRISLNFSLPSKERVKKTLDLKEFFLQNAPSASTRRLKSDLDVVQEKLVHGDKCLHMTFTIVIEGESQTEIQERTRAILNILHHDLECEAIVDETIGLGLCLNTLPLMHSPETDYSTQRYVKILKSDVLNFLPIFDSFKGYEDPLQVYLSREGNIVFYSILEKGRPSHHSVVLADTGSGKSAFVLDVVQAFKRRYPDPLIFFVEKRASSKMLAKLFGGEVTVFRPNGDIPFSPFRGHFDDEKVNVLSLIVMTAIRLSNPKFDPQSEHSSIVTQALKDAYRRKVAEGNLKYANGKILENGVKGETQITMDDVVAAMGALHDDSEYSGLGKYIDELVQKLREYSGDGKYARYFRGSENTKADGDCSFYVYDLDALDSDPILQALMTLSVFEEIKRLIALPENRERGALIIFEEMGQLGSNNETATKYVVNFAETIRKLGSWLIGIAPNPRNFFETAAGRALWEAADNYIFLSMKADNVDFILKNSKVLSPDAGLIVKSLRTIVNEYAELFVTNKTGTRRGAMRYIQSRYNRWIAPTNPDAERKVEEALKSTNQDALAALDLLAASV